MSTIVAINGCFSSMMKVFFSYAYRSSRTWFSVAPLWGRLVRRWWGPLSLNRTKPSLPETTWSMLPDDILKISPEDIIDRQQLMHFTVQFLYVSVLYFLINLILSLFRCTHVMWHCYLMSNWSLRGATSPPFWTALSRSLLMSSAWQNRPALSQTPTWHQQKQHVVKYW